MPETVLGVKLKKLRKEKRITQGKLSEKLGFSPRYISQVEAGMTRPSMDAFKKIADFFQVPVEYLVSESEETSNLATAPIRNKALLQAFMEVDRLGSEDQKLALGLLNALITNHKMKSLLEGKQL
ncbi:MAG: helix-turn-helix domain-containing protein [Bacillota bacterium]